MYLSKLKVSVPLLIKFVTENGDSNVARDGNLNISDDADGDSARNPKATEPIKHRQVIFGCCGRAILMNVSMDTVPLIHLRLWSIRQDER
jgi:hypothetical protein